MKVLPWSISSLIARPVQSDSLDGLGSVIDTQDEPRVINDGKSRKWDRLIPPEAFEVPMNLGILQTQPGGLTLRALERHRHTHQFFVPMEPRPYVVVVAGRHSAAPQAGDVRAFLCDGTQGVCFNPDTWHSPLIPVRGTTTFLTAMRDSSTPDLDIYEFSTSVHLLIKESSE